LICIRYRYDYANRKKYKTVELIVTERDWHPDEKKIPLNKRVYLQINYKELELRQKIKVNGGVWDVNKKLWHLPYNKVLELELQNRIVRGN